MYWIINGPGILLIALSILYNFYELGFIITAVIIL